MFLKLYRLFLKNSGSSGLALLLMLASFGLSAQRPPDTTYGQGSFLFQNANNNVAIPNINAQFRAIAMIDSIIHSIYQKSSDTNGVIPFDLPVSVDYHIGLREDVLTKNLQAYPIPGNELNIALPNAGNYTTAVFNLNGQQVAAAQTNNDRLAYISLDNLPTAPYIVQVRNDKGELMHTQKTIKIEGSVNGPYLSPIAAINLLGNNKKAELMATATYRVNYDAPQGFVDDSVDLAISDGANGIIPININPWDTGYAVGNLVFRDNLNRSTKFVPIEIIINSMQQVNSNFNLTTTTGAGSVIPQYNIPVAIDTTGNPATTSAQVKLSWPETTNPDLDSTTVTGGIGSNIRFEGWYAGDTTITLSPGINPNTFITTLQQKPLDPRINKGQVEFSLGQFDRNYTRTAANNALIIIHNHTQNTTDSIYTDAQGYAVSPRYTGTDSLSIGAGYPGGTGTNGEELKMFKGVPLVIEGNTYNKLVSGDTTQTIMANFIPDTTHINGINQDVFVSAFDMKDAHQGPALGQQKDTVYYNINNTVNGGFTFGQEQAIDEVADSASQVLPITYVKTNTPLTNPPMYPANYTTSSHGANIFKGSNNISSIQTINLNNSIIGENAAYLTADVEVGGSKAEIWKELVYQYHAFGGVSSINRPSVMNGNPALPTLVDFATFYIKHFTEREMFKGTSNASTGTPTQNISINYYFDNNNISAQ